MMNVVAVLTGAALIASAAAAEASCPTQGSGSVGELHRAWILEGWERREGDPRFVFPEKLGRFYDFTGEGVIIHDSFDPQKRIARSAAEYGSFFEAVFNGFRSARHAVTDGPHVVVGRDLATSSLEFVARLETNGGQVSGQRAQSQTVWRCTAGGWRIVREQNAVAADAVGTVERVLADRTASTATLLVEPGARTSPTVAAERVRTAFEAWAKGEGDIFNELLSEQVVWTIEGSGRYARTYTSRAQFLAEAVEPLGRRLARPVRPTVRRMFSEGNTVAVVWDGEAVATDGLPYRNSFVWIFDMDGEKATQVTAFLDLPSFEAVLDRIRR